MSFERIDPEKQIPDFDMKCPDCGGRTLHIHDLRCLVCDNREIVYCKNCDRHFRARFDQ